MASSHRFLPSLFLFLISHSLAPITAGALPEEASLLFLHNFPLIFLELLALGISLSSLSASRHSALPEI